MKESEKECIIISGAPSSTFPKDINFEKSFVYCADYGCRYAEKLGITPDIVIGDFDTYPKGKETGCETLEYSSHKDETDTMLCVMNALGKGFKKIRILSALGGRFDHMFANIQTLDYIFSNGAVGFIEDENNIITMQYKSEEKYIKREKYYFSLFAYNQKVSSVTIEGTEYTADNIELENNFPLGVSNRIVDEYATVKKGDGKLLVVYSKDA
jgi:thiamine pyrophosphokinase